MSNLDASETSKTLAIYVILPFLSASDGGKWTSVDRHLEQ